MQELKASLTGGDYRIDSAGDRAAGQGDAAVCRS